MTRITKLEMKGFKSFANKTELVFGEKFNVILGPNGSGKSNVFDSLCFVLGKSSAKGLRADKSANLIYNGGKSKKPAKSGEVSIYFDNSKKAFPIDTAELKLTRIIRSSGQSIYKINDQTRTRQQVLEILSVARIDPQGHNIVLQGDIVHLVEMSPLERREIIEEIAGISVYEEKKEKALRELTRVENKINEAEIILTERKGYLRELKKERDQAQKYKDLDDKIKRNKATLLDKQIREKSSKRTELEKNINGNNEEIEKIQNKINELKKKVEEKKEEIEIINKEVEEKGEKEQVQVHKEIEQIRVDFALNKQRIETLKQELFKLGERKSELERSHKEIDDKIKIINRTKHDAINRIEQKEREVNQINAKLSVFKEKNKIEDAQDIDVKIEEIDKNADEIQEKISRLREQQQNLLREKDKYELRLQGVDERIEKVLLLKKENKDAIETLKKNKEQFKETANELNTCITEDSSLSAQLNNARSKLLSRKEELARVNARNAGIKEQIFGNKAIKAVLDLKGQIKGIHGPVSQLGNVGEEYSLALGIAAGARMRSIVVETDEVAAKCITYLKEHRLGIATFLPLNKLRPSIIKTELRTLKGSHGVVGMAIDLVNYDEKYAKVFQYVFGNTLIVEDVNTARKIGIGKIRMVTKTGDLMDQSGAMQGGHREKSSTLRFQEQEVTNQIKQLESEINDSTNIVSKLEKSKNDNENRLSELKSTKAELEAEILKTERSLHLDSDDMGATEEEKTKLQEEITRIDSELAKIQGELQSMNKEMVDMKIEKQKLREKITELRNPALLAEMNSFEEKKQELREELSSLRGDLKNSDSEISNILMPEKENIDKILKQQIREKEEFENENKKLVDVVKEQGKNLIEKEKQEKKFYAQFKGLFNSRTKLSEEVSKAENIVSNKQDDLRRFEHKNNSLSIDRAKIVGELEGLEEEYKQYEGVPLFKNKSEEEIKREVYQFERMTQDIGAVNMKALEIYEKAETEYNSLTNKKEKLAHEREDVLILINEIDSKKKDLFMKTFNVLNKNFEAIFKTLATKGEAFLKLEDEKDPFNGGTEIKVRIAGKKFLDIRSLSGGEKTMTALAFIFAVQEHDPASFYILDEVDAALDKKNSEKLAELVRQYSGRAQYILVSHNDGVITQADNLYGVSMNGATATSKVTSLKI